MLLTTLTTGEEDVVVDVRPDVYEQVINMIVRVGGHVQMDHSVTTAKEEEHTAAAMMNNVKIVDVINNPTGT